MVILSTLLHVLLIIGKVLLFLVLAVLIILALILLAPFGYKAKVKADKEHFQADGGVSWLWIVARVRFHLRDKEQQFEVYILGIPLMKLLQRIRGRKKKQGNAGASGDAAKANEAKAELHSADRLNIPGQPEGENSRTDFRKPEIENGPGDSGKTEIENGPGDSGKPEAESGRKESDQHDDAEQGRTEAGQLQAEIGQGDQKDTGPEQKAVSAKKADVQHRIKTVKKKIETVRKQKAAAKRQKKALREQKKAVRNHSGGRRFSDKISEITGKIRWALQLLHTEMFQEALDVTKRGGMRILKHVVPKKTRGFVRFGFNDPSLTGKTCGVLAMLYPKMPKDLRVIPEFQEACFEADVEFRGRVFLIYFIIQGVKIILNRNVRMLIKVVRKKVPLEKVIAAENKRSGGKNHGK